MKYCYLRCDCGEQFPAIEDNVKYDYRNWQLYYDARDSGWTQFGCTTCSQRQAVPIANLQRFCYEATDDDELAFDFWRPVMPKEIST